jgi:predicted deacetylase
MTRRLCIALHDVAPATWPACARLLAMLDEIGAAPVTLLVVPDFHGLGRIDRDAGFVASIEQRIRRGDEIALHGYAHRDDASPPRNPWGWFRRRLLTANEGEFSALDHADARQRIQRGIDLMSRLNWNVAGFVPPAWLVSSGTAKALAEMPLRYTSTHTALVDLRGRPMYAPCITASSRSSWRRALSRLWMRATATATRHVPLIRVGLHPEDALHPTMIRAWRKLLIELLSDRQPMTKIAALAASSADTGIARFDMPGKAPSKI